MSDSTISIRPLATWDEFLAVEELQRSIWQMPDWRDAVPANLLITIHKNGGVALGAFEGVKLVGFVFSFIGSETKNGASKMKHCSHMLAVLPEYQSRQVGARLKFAQRAAVLAQRIDLITWTYDPLLAVNASLNLGRLGAIARHYIPDAYGQMTDGLNAGLASDRFQAEWWLNAPQVVERALHPEQTLRGHEQSGRHVKRQLKDWDKLGRSGAQEIFSIRVDTRGFPHIEQADEPRAQILIAEIPLHMGAIKAADLDLAREWRMRTREFFSCAFAIGYIANDFIFAARGNDQRAAYVLVRAVEEEGAHP